MAHIAIFFAVLTAIIVASDANPIITTESFQTVILERNHSQCQNSVDRCVYVEFLPHEVDRRSSSFGKSSSSNNKNENDENDEIIQLTPAFTYLGQYIYARCLDKWY